MMELGQLGNGHVEHGTSGHGTWYKCMMELGRDAH